MNTLTETLKQGIMIELNGYHHYHTASQQTSDKSARAVFKQLAADEAMHGRALQQMLEQYEQTCEISARPLAGRPTVKAKGADPIFSPEFKQKIADKHYELTALSVGVMLEENSIAFYRGWAAKTRDPKLMKLLKQLVAWEETHLAALMVQRRTFMESYWSTARFYPF